MKKIFTLIAFVSVFGFCAQAQHELIKIQTTDKEAFFDGMIDEGEPWGSTWLDVAVTKDPMQGGDADFAAKFQMFNTEKSLILAVVVEDATEDASATDTYQRDCVEFFFNMDAAYKEKAYVAGIWQFRAQRVENAALTKGYFDATNPVTDALKTLTDDADFKFAIDNTSDGYTIEIAFPKAALTQTANFDGKNFNFELQVANADGGVRTGQRWWGNNSDSQWNDATTFSPIEIEGGNVGVKEMAAVKGSAFVRNNVLNVNNVNGLVSIFSVNGSLVRKAIVNGNSTIDIADLKSGIYFIKGDNISEKFVK